VNGRDNEEHDCRDGVHAITHKLRTATLTGPPPIILDFRSDAIGGSASDASLSFVMDTFNNVRFRSSALAEVKDRSNYSTEG
jgi:hypothetical protein